LQHWKTRTLQDYSIERSQSCNASNKPRPGKQGEQHWLVRSIAAMEAEKAIQGKFLTSCLKSQAIRREKG
jgi:hypothetical protein